MNLKYIYLGTAIITTMLGAGASHMDRASADDGGGQYVNAVNPSQTYVDIAGNTNAMAWSNPFGQKDSQWVANLSDFRGKTVNVTQMYTDTNNNIKWAKVNLPNGKSGWIADDALSGGFTYLGNFSQSIHSNEKMKINVKHNYDNAFKISKNSVFASMIPSSQTTKYAAGNDNAIYKSLSNYDNQLVTVDGYFVDQNGTKWATVSVGDSSWMPENDNFVIDASLLEKVNGNSLSNSMTNFYALDQTWRAKSDGSGDIWDRPYGINGAKILRSSSTISNQTFRVDKIADSNTGHWVHLENVGWVHNDTLTWNGGKVFDGNTDSTGYNRYGIWGYSWVNSRSPFKSYNGKNADYHIGLSTPNVTPANFIDDGNWHPVY